MNVIHMVVRTVQFALFIFSFGLVYHIYIEKNTTKQRILLLASICSVRISGSTLDTLRAKQQVGGALAVCISTFVHGIHAAPHSNVL